MTEIPTHRSGQTIAGGRRPLAGAADGGGPGDGVPRHRQRRDPGNGGNVKPRSFLWRWRRVFFVVALFMLATVASAGVVFARTELPEIDPLAQSTFVCAADVPFETCNAQNAMARLQGDEDRANVTLARVPEVLVNAVIATEDQDFFKHKGLDPVGIGRALYRDLLGSESQQGGSTITQQYVKNAFRLSREKAVTRKLKEAVLSVKLEQQMSKEDILEGYLNTIYFGRGAYGIQAASQTYFGKDVQKIGLPEAAYLAGLIRAPASADPQKHPEEAARRRKVSLDAMVDEGYITEEEAAVADAVPFTEPYVRPLTTRKVIDTAKRYADVGGDYVTAYVHELLKNEYGFSDEEIAGGGLRVYTSLNPTYQDAAWSAVTSTLTDPNDPEAALVAIDNQGLIRAMVGSRHPFEAAKYQNNYAVRGMGSPGRQSGSTFKPIVLAEAIRQGISLESRYDAQAKMVFPGANNGGDWTVSNYSESSQGVLDLIDATRVSSNTAFAQLMMDVGPENVVEMAHKLGITAEMGPYNSIVLGTEDVSPLEMATVFSTFANRGVRKDPKIITRIEQVDQDGNITTLYEWKAPKGERVLPESQADLVTHVLQGVIEGGTGTGANFGKPAAGKTGTAQRNRDAMFAGYVPKLTAAVWMGYAVANWDDPGTAKVEKLTAPMDNVHGRSVTGGSFPAEIWRKFMEAATAASNLNDDFVEVSEDQIEFGRVIHEGELFTSEETTTTTPLPTFVPLPPLPGPGRPGGPKPTPSTSLPEITLPTLPSTTTTSSRGGGGPGPG